MARFKKLYLVLLQIYSNMANVEEFTPLPTLQRMSAKRTYAMFSSQSLDGFPENEQVSVFSYRRRLRVDDIRYLFLERG